MNRLSLIKKQILEYINYWNDNYDYTESEGESYPLAKAENIKSFFEGQDIILGESIIEDIEALLEECLDEAKHNLIYNKSKSGDLGSEVLVIFENLV